MMNKKSWWCLRDKLKLSPPLPLALQQVTNHARVHAHGHGHGLANVVWCGVCGSACVCVCGLLCFVLLFCLWLKRCVCVRGCVCFVRLGLFDLV